MDKLLVRVVSNGAGHEKPLGSHETLGLGLRQGSSRTDATPPGLDLEANNRRRLRVASGGRRDIR